MHCKGSAQSIVFLQSRSERELTPAGHVFFINTLYDLAEGLKNPAVLVLVVVPSFSCFFG